ncbi:MAG: hypothetical protein ACQESP_04095 [Candidatus Muiribacteriota bacterium]
MNKLKIISFFLVFLLAGCSTGRFFSPKAVLWVENIEPETLVYTSETESVEADFTVNVSNGVGVKFVQYEVIYYYDSSLRISSLNEFSGALTKFASGYDKINIPLRIISSELIDFAYQSDEHKNVETVIAHIKLYGVDENENQVSASEKYNIIFE